MTIRPDYTHVSAKDQIASAESEVDAPKGKSLAYGGKLQASDRFLVPETLEPARAALIVRLLNGKLSAIDGPFAETKEGPGGSILIDAGDREEESEPATQRLCGAFKDTPHPLCPGRSTPSRGRHAALLVVVAAMVLASVPAPAGAQEWWVRFDGRVQWLAGDLMVVSANGRSNVSVDLRRVPQDEYGGLSGGDWVMVIGVIRHSDRRVIGISVRRVETEAW
jgi:hypothetical protein